MNSEEKELRASSLEEIIEIMSKECEVGDRFSITLKSGRIITLEVKNVEVTN